MTRPLLPRLQVIFWAVFLLILLAMFSFVTDIGRHSCAWGQAIAYPKCDLGEGIYCTAQDIFPDGISIEIVNLHDQSILWDAVSFEAVGGSMQCYVEMEAIPMAPGARLLLNATQCTPGRNVVGSINFFSLGYAYFLDDGVLITGEGRLIDQVAEHPSEETGQICAEES